MKTEFGKFAGQLQTVQKQLQTASTSLEILNTTRTNVMQRKLKSVESFSNTNTNETNITTLNKPIDNELNP